MPDMDIIRMAERGFAVVGTKNVFTGFAGQASRDVMARSC